MKECAVLITVGFDSDHQEGGPGQDLEGFSEELKELADSAGLWVVENMARRQKGPNASLYIGKGLAQEVAGFVRRHKAHAVLFGGNLSGSQQRNLEQIVGCKVVDRTQLILDIFAQRAKSSEGKLQVELAQLKYLLPRLSGKGVEMSRLGGGIGTRGPGEQKLEMDRRRIREHIKHLKRQLETLEKRRLAGIERKKEKDLPLIAIVGYTNAGKSCLFNRLTQSSVLVKDKLFATLDTTTRIVLLNPNQKALLADTVGFIRDLPHDLIEAFKATLEETVHADFLVHVIDASMPDYADKEKAVKKVLGELGVSAKPVLLVYNKSDKLGPAVRQSFLSSQNHREVFLISALNGEGINDLLSAIAKRFEDNWLEWDVFIASGQLGLSKYLYEKALVLDRQDRGEGTTFKVKITRGWKQFILNKLEPAV